MKVRVSTHLRGYTGGRAEVDAQGGTLGDVVRDLDRQFPGVRFRIVDEQGQVREHIKMFVDGVHIDDLAARVSPAGTVHIIGALSGG
jgi:molybdopterin synthase sulfur carrier subunit